MAFLEIATPVCRENNDEATKLQLDVREAKKLQLDVMLARLANSPETLARNVA